MAIKKNELYSSLWASCDKLRGGMDASQYKDYILTLLFVKYVTDKFKGVKYADITVPEGGSFDDLVALKGDKNIGEKMDKVIAKLADAENNNLRGVIDNAHFNDEAKLGKGDEMVDKLTGLISIFQRPEFDFKNNKAAGDDILGDAYEYLMRNFATESGKSKGQFYTPAEVSRILAKVIGIDKVDDPDTSVYDPACGSGSLLIRAADEAPIEVAIYGQEKEITTAGLAKMNLVLHNKATGEIYAGNTFSDPHYKDEKDESVLRRFDFAVANPPFSLKNWTDGLKDYGRFSGYGDTPPEKNGDFAWLLHILMYIALFALGSLCRYKPEIWNPFVKNDITGEKLLIKKFLQYSYRLIPNFVLNHIYGKTIIYSGEKYVPVDTIKLVGEHTVKEMINKQLYELQEAQRRMK